MRSKISLSNKSTYIYFIVTTIIYIICLYLLGRNLTFDTLWYDEAGQFFIAKGLNHYSSPLSPEGSIWDVLVQNSHYNQDPGGFSIILHFWSKLSNNIIWLRLLPFIFFIGAIVFTCLAVYEITTNKLVAYTSGLLLFALWGGQIPYELRPYSMELCGMAYGLWMVFRLRKYKVNHLSEIFLYSVILCFFLTARYTIIMFCMVYTFFALYFIWKNDIQRSVYHHILACLAFCLPLLCCVTYIYFLETKIQNSDLHSWEYIVYLYTSHWPFKLYGLGLLLSIVLLKWTNKSARILTYLCLSINILFIILGYFKLLPWCFTGNKGGAFVWLLYITFFCISYSIINSRSFQSRYRSYYIYLTMACILIIFSSMLLSSLGLWKDRQYSIGKVLNEIPSNSKLPILINEYLIPTLRFHYEYVNHNNKIPYPEGFILLNGKPHSQYGKQEEELIRQHNTIRKEAPSGSLYLDIIIIGPQSVIPTLLVKNDPYSFEPYYPPK